MAGGMGLGSFLSGMAGGMQQGMKVQAIKGRMDERQALQTALEKSTLRPQEVSASQQQGMGLAPEQKPQAAPAAQATTESGSPLSFIKSLWE